MAFVVVNMEASGSAVPPLNSAAAVVALKVSAVPAVVGAAFMVKVVALVTEATVALFAKPVPVSDMPFTRPAVLSQVTAVLAAVVVAFVKVTPQAVSVSPAPVPVAACERTNVVAFVMEATVVLPVCVPLMLPAMFGPVMSIPGHSAAVLAQVTVVLPLVVATLVRLMAVRFEVLTA
jgi:hypothetical protein